MSTPLPQVLCHFCGENMWVSASQGPRIEVFSDRTDVICPRCDAVHVGLPSPDPKTTVVGELRGGRRSRLIRIPGDEERRLACPRCWDRRDVADRGNAYRFGRYLKAGDNEIDAAEYELQRSNEPWYADPGARTDARWLRWKEHGLTAHTVYWEEARGKVHCLDCKYNGMGWLERLYDVDRNGIATADV